MHAFKNNKLPPKTYRQIIDELSVLISNPALKLKLLKKSLASYDKIPFILKIYPPMGEIAFRKKTLDIAEQIQAGSRKKGYDLIHKGHIKVPKPVFWRMYKYRHVIISLIVILFFWGMGSAIASFLALIGESNMDSNQVKIKNQAALSEENPEANQPLVARFNINHINNDSKARSAKKGKSESVDGKNVFDESHFQLSKNKSQENETHPTPNNSDRIILKKIDKKNSPINSETKINPEATTQIAEKITRVKTLASAKKSPFTEGRLSSNISFELQENKAITPGSKNHSNPPSSSIKPLEPASNTALKKDGNLNEIANDIPKFVAISPQTILDRYSKDRPLKFNTEDVTQIKEYITTPIWLVEKTKKVEIYSNRLNIITTHSIENPQRAYYLFSKNSDQLPETHRKHNKIIGIMYHSSESDLFPFKPEMNTSIKKNSAQLREYICRKKAYNYFIDRFGRVYRIVKEENAAFHAGNSIWGDEDYIYLNLNHAFIGICFEGRDFDTNDIMNTKDKNNPQKTRIMAKSNLSITEAQIQSGKELTDWLRFKHHINEHNCIPHGLASVSPETMLIGYHLDLSKGFPFHRFGLSNKYNETLPSITEFGFSYDNYFSRIFNGKLWPGISRSYRRLKQQAELEKLSVLKYRKRLNDKYYKFYRFQKETIQEHKALSVQNIYVIGRGR